MPQTSPPKHGVNLGDRLQQKIEADAELLARKTEERLNKLAEDSSVRLRQSVTTAVADIQANLSQIVRLSAKAWIISLATSTVLTLGVLIGLGLYASWKLHEVNRLATRQQEIEASLKQLPPEFSVMQGNRKRHWYLIARSIGTPENGAKLHSKPAQFVQIDP